jgi:6-pyruvoyl-tetrahydropterin synthase
LHVVPIIGFDPVRFENLNSSTDTTIVTTDAFGVLHTIGISSLTTGTGSTSIASSCSTANFVPKVQTTGSGNLTCSQIYDNGTEVGIGTSTPAAGWELEVNGDIKCVSLWATSDAKFKKDITPLKNANDIISKLQGVTYNWRTEEFKEKKFTNENQIGFIAQEVQKVLPAAVTKDANGDFAINYIEIIPVLTEAMKEQNATIENQNSKIENLENQLAEIKAMLSNGNKSNLNTHTQIANNNIKIYPNPIRNNNLNIEMYTHNEGSIWITISDMQGKEVARKQFTTCANCTNNLTFDLPQLSNGNYHVSIVAEGQITTEKFTIAK